MPTKCLYLLLALCCYLFVGCEKNKNGVANCRGLIQDALPPGDTGFAFIADAFTPNGDGLNDNISVTTTGIDSLLFTLYDEKYKILFQSTEVPQIRVPYTLTNNRFQVKYYFRIEAYTTSGNLLGKCGAIRALDCIPKDTLRDYFLFGDQYDPSNPRSERRIPTGERLPVCK